MCSNVSPSPYLFPVGVPIHNTGEDGEKTLLMESSVVAELRIGIQELSYFHIFLRFLQIRTKDMNSNALLKYCYVSTLPQIVT